MLSFSIGLLLAYRKGTDFSKLILYPVTRLKIFISTSFLVDLQSLKSSHYLSANGDKLMFSFPICMPSIFSFYFAAPANALSTVMKWSGVNEQSCLLPNFNLIVLRFFFLHLG